MQNPWQNADGSDTQLMQLYKVGADRNPVQNSQFKQMLQQNGLPGDASPGSFSANVASSTAQAAQDMQLKANQPAITTLQSQYNPDTGGGALVDRYKDLIDSITAAEQPAVDVATRGVNAALAARGIVSSNQGEGNQELQGVLNPLTANFGQLKAQTGLSEQQDLGNIASQIAGLRAGNVPNALSYAGGLGQAQIGANASMQNAQTAAAAQIASQRLANQFQNVAPGNNLVNTLNNVAINPSTLTSKNNGVAVLR